MMGGLYCNENGSNAGNEIMREVNVVMREGGCVYVRERATATGFITSSLGVKDSRETLKMFVIL